MGSGVLVWEDWEGSICISVLVACLGVNDWLEIGKICCSACLAYKWWDELLGRGSYEYRLQCQQGSISHDRIVDCRRGFLNTE